MVLNFFPEKIAYSRALKHFMSQPDLPSGTRFLFGGSRFASFHVLSEVMSVRRLHSGGKLKKISMSMEDDLHTHCQADSCSKMHEVQSSLIHFDGINPLGQDKTNENSLFVNVLRIFFFKLYLIQ